MNRETDVVRESAGEPFVFEVDAASPNGGTQSVADDVEAPQKLRGDPWRFSVGVVFCFISISNAMQWITFSAIVEEVRVYFNMTAIQVNYLSTTYVIAYVAAVFLSCKLYEVTGLKIGIVIAALTNAIGAMLKIIALYAWPNMVLLYMAQAFNSITEILTIATPPLIANRWFPEGERMVANTILSSALNFGCALGVLFPTFFVTPEKQEKHHFGNLFWFQFGLCGGMLLLAIFLIPARPRYMASYAAARQQRGEEKRLLALSRKRSAQRNQQDGGEVPSPTLTNGNERNLSRRNSLHEVENRSVRSNNVADNSVHSPTRGVNNNNNNSNNEISRNNRKDEMGDSGLESEREVQPINVFSTILDSLRMLRKNPSFGFLMIASAAELGLIWAVATVLPQCLGPFGITEAESGWISFLNLFAGTVVAPFVMPFLTRNQNYKTILVTIAMILTVNMSVLTLCLAYGPAVHTNRTFFVGVTFVLWGGVAGLCQNFMMPLMFEFVVELTFPMAESTSAPVLTWSACLTNLILTIVFGEVLGNDPSQSEALRVFIGATVVCFIGGLALLMVYPYRRRHDYETLMRKREDARLLRQQGIMEVEGENGELTRAISARQKGMSLKNA